MIGAKLSALKGTKAYEHLMRFGFGGTCTVLAWLVAKKFGPVVGGLFLALPAIFPAGASLIAKHEEQKKAQVGADGSARGRIAAGVDAEGAALGALGLVGFAVVVWKWLPMESAPVVIAGACVAWALIAGALFGLYRVRWMERMRRRRRVDR